MNLKAIFLAVALLLPFAATVSSVASAEPMPAAQAGAPAPKDGGVPEGKRGEHAKGDHAKGDRQNGRHGKGGHRRVEHRKGDHAKGRRAKGEHGKGGRAHGRHAGTIRVVPPWTRAAMS